MSTRAVITFVEDMLDGTNVEHHVYRGEDGDPYSIATKVKTALAYTWKMPRFEADHFACGFIAVSIMETVAICKKCHAPQEASGNHRTRLTRHWKEHSDLEYRYEVYQEQPAGEVMVKAFAVHKWGTDFRFYHGKLHNFISWTRRQRRKEKGA